MEVQQGYSYHIKDAFFGMVQDKCLMSNKENGSYEGKGNNMPIGKKIWLKCTSKSRLEVILSKDLISAMF